MALTALQSLDLLEKNYLYEGVKPPAPEAHKMMWVGTSLGIGDASVLIGEGELEEIIETPEYAPIPGTKPWVLGVAAHKGGLLPVISGDVLFRKTPYTGRPREYCMVIRRAGYYFAMTLSSIERDLKFPIEQRDMDCNVDADFAEFCLGGFQHGDKFLAVLDIDKLVADGDLANAAATERNSTEGKSNG
jgi:twitching motility protein PilI